MKNATVLSILIVFVSAVSACTTVSSSTAVPTKPPTVSPTWTPTATSTLTPTPLPTLTPIPTPTPPPLQAQGYESIAFNDLCLQIEQSFPNIEDAEPELISEPVQRLLDQLSIQVISDTIQCDATLSIDLLFSVEGQKYTSKLFCYSNPKVVGEVRFDIQEQPPYVVSVGNLVPAPKVLDEKYCYETPAEAAFHRVWPKAVLDGLYELWGLPIPTTALADTESRQMREAAALVLKELGPQAMEAVPALIETLEICQHNTGWLAPLTVRQALVAITEQEFGGREVEAWQQWWQEQQ